ncbi:MerR family transcriptional regulator [Dehalococcoidia bacterium]|nr:MerR family transcriptional regulator [Dehalococcoidia bacterium]
MTIESIFDHEDPVFIISVAARILGVQAQTLRYYERLGLIAPARTRGNQRVFSHEDIDRVRRIRGLMDDLGVNLAGVDVVLRLLDKLREAERKNRRLLDRVAGLRTALGNRR